MISGLFLKYLNGECFVIWRGYETTLLASTKFNLTVPGDSIKVRLRVKHKTPRNEDYGEVRWHVTLTNQNDEKVAEYELLTMNAYTS